MGAPVLVQNDWAGGMKQDKGIEGVPSSAAWSIENMLPGLGGFSLGLRGGYTYVSDDIKLVNANLLLPQYLGWFPVSTTANHLYVMDQNGRTVAVDISDGSVSTRTQNGGNMGSNPVYYNGVLCVAGSVPCQYTTAGAHSALTGAPALGTLEIYGARLVGHNGNRIYFSGNLNQNSWDTSATGNWIDTSYPIRCLVALSSSLLIFSENHIERLRGDTPGGGGLAGNIVRESLFDTGVWWSNNVCVADDKCYFVNASGVYMTDGAALVDLTNEGGMKLGWANLYEGTVLPKNTSIAYGSGWLWLVNTIGEGWMINVSDRSFHKFTLGPSNSGYALGALTVQGAVDYAYFPLSEVGSPDQSFVASMTPTLEQSSTHDPTGSAITGILQTRAYMAGGPYKRFRSLYPRYEVTDPDSANPAIAIKAHYEPMLSPGDDLASGSDFTLAETSDITRTRLRLNTLGRSVAFHIETSGKGHPVGIQSLEIDAHELERSRI